MRQWYPRAIHSLLVMAWEEEEEKVKSCNEWMASYRLIQCPVQCLVVVYWNG